MNYTHIRDKISSKTLRFCILYALEKYKFAFGGQNNVKILKNLLCMIGKYT